MGSTKEFVVPAIGRSIPEQMAYVEAMRLRRQVGNAACILCERIAAHEQSRTHIKIGGRAIKFSNPAFLLIPNDFPYESYDGHQVLAHHMLVPRDHHGITQIMSTKKLRRQRQDAEAELLSLTGDYYATSMYRTDSSQASSVKNHYHQHWFRLGKPIKSQTFSIPSQQNDVVYFD